MYVEPVIECQRTSERGFCRIIPVARAIVSVTGVIRNILYYYCSHRKKNKICSFGKKIFLFVFVPRKLRPLQNVYENKFLLLMFLTMFIDTMPSIVINFIRFYLHGLSMLDFRLIAQIIRTFQNYVKCTQWPKDYYLRCQGCEQGYFLWLGSHRYSIRFSSDS